MYRLTGDRKWQEKGWKMFVSWMEVARVPGGISSVVDVTRESTAYGDNMESFMFAETFK
jgi:mannosyl-oligosaccharide alpha-1,2-mannosidase